MIACASLRICSPLAYSNRVLTLSIADRWCGGVGFTKSTSESPDGFLEAGATWNFSRASHQPKPRRPGTHVVATGAVNSSTAQVATAEAGTNSIAHRHRPVFRVGLHCSRDSLKEDCHAVNGEVGNAGHNLLREPSLSSRKSRNACFAPADVDRVLQIAEEMAGREEDGLTNIDVWPG